MFRIVLLQIAATVVVAFLAALLSGFIGANAGTSAAITAFCSALLGGVCCFVPNGLFALRLHASARQPGGANPFTFLFGEMVKIAATFALMGAVVWLYRDANWLVFIISFIVVLKSYFILLFRHRP